MDDLLDVVSTALGATLTPDLLASRGCLQLNDPVFFSLPCCSDRAHLSISDHDALICGPIRGATEILEADESSSPHGFAPKTSLAALGPVKKLSVCHWSPVYVQFSEHARSQAFAMKLPKPHRAFAVLLNKGAIAPSGCAQVQCHPPGADLRDSITDTDFLLDYCLYNLSSPIYMDAL